MHGCRRHDRGPGDRAARTSLTTAEGKASVSSRRRWSRSAATDRCRLDPRCRRSRHRPSTARSSWRTPRRTPSRRRSTQRHPTNAPRLIRPSPPPARAVKTKSFALKKTWARSEAGPPRPSLTQAVVPGVVTAVRVSVFAPSVTRAPMVRGESVSTTVLNSSGADSRPAWKSPGTGPLARCHWK